jgi:hypothetical protein
MFNIFIFVNRNEISVSQVIVEKVPMYSIFI